MNTNSLATFVEPSNLDMASFELPLKQPSAVAMPSQKIIEEPIASQDNQSPPKPGFDMSMIMGLLPLLTGGGSGGNEAMMQIIQPMLAGKKIGGIDVGTVLPLVMNSGILSGLFSAKPKDVADANKFININDYKLVK